MSEHKTVLHNVKGAKLTAWNEDEVPLMICPNCGLSWYAIYVEGAQGLRCPECDTVVDIPKEIEGMTVDIMKEWTREEYEDLLSLTSHDNPRNVMAAMSVTFLVRAPIYWWYSMETFTHGTTDFHIDFPVTVEDFAVPASLDDADRVNECENDPHLMMGHVPMGLYMTGAVTLTYKEIHDLLQQYGHSPNYEWHVFVEAVYEKLELISITAPPHPEAV